MTFSLPNTWTFWIDLPESLSENNYKQDFPINWMEITLYKT